MRPKVEQERWGSCLISGYPAPVSRAVALILGAPVDPQKPSTILRLPSRIPGILARLTKYFQKIKGHESATRHPVPRLPAPFSSTKAPAHMAWHRGAVGVGGPMVTLYPPDLEGEEVTLPRGQSLNPATSFPMMPPMGAWLKVSGQDHGSVGTHGYSPKPWPCKLTYSQGPQ